MTRNRLNLNLNDARSSKVKWWCMISARVQCQVLKAEIMRTNPRHSVSTDLQPSPKSTSTLQTFLTWSGTWAQNPDRNTVLLFFSQSSNLRPVGQTIISDPERTASSAGILRQETFTQLVFNSRVRLFMRVSAAWSFIYLFFCKNFFKRPKSQPGTSTEIFLALHRIELRKQPSSLRLL